MYGRPTRARSSTVPSTAPRPGGYSLGRILKVCDEICALVGLLQPGEDHLCPGNVLFRIQQVLVQALFVPRHALILIRRRIRKTLRGARNAPKQPAKIRALRAQTQPNATIASVPPHNKLRALDVDAPIAFALVVSPRALAPAPLALDAPSFFLETMISHTKPHSSRARYRPLMRSTYLLMPTPALGDVALRALRFKNLRPCLDRTTIRRQRIARNSRCALALSRRSRSRSRAFDVPRAISPAGASANVAIVSRTRAR